MSDFTDAVEANARRTVKLMEDKKALKAKVARLEARIAEQDELLAAKMEKWAGWVRDHNVVRCEALTAALREMDAWASRMPDAGFTAASPRYLWWFERPVAQVRAALVEEPYADVPGAGQRGC